MPENKNIQVLDLSQHYRSLLERSLGIPFSEGNAIEVLKNGDEIFPAMLKAIREAEQRIDFLTFVYWKGDIADRFAKELAKKAEAGVEVRVILDSYGAAFIREELTELMEKKGVNLEWFRPISNWKVWKTDNRTHRKVLICDGEIAFTGGVGIAEEWEGDANNPSEWRETHYKIQGPSVFGLQAAFMENWIETGRDLQLDTGWNNHPDPDSDRHDALVQVLRTSASVRWSDIVMLYQTLIKAAKKNIRITTAYFNPNQAVVNLLVGAVERGVEVDIMIPGKHTDQRVANIAGSECFKELLEAGVTLWYYQKTMLHSKVITVDDTVCCIGSANFNHRSMLKDDEINMVVIDSDLAATLNKHFEDDLTWCDQIEEGDWEKRSLVRRCLESVTNIFKQQI